MATRTISATGGNWNATTAWVEASVPTAADDVVATALSGALTVNGTSGSPSLCRSADFTGYTSTLTMGSTAVLNVGDAAGGSFKLVAGMTFAPNVSAIINFISTTTGNSITTAGKSLGFTVFNGSGGAWSLADAFTCQRDLTMTIGTVTSTSTISVRQLLTNGGTLNLGGNVTLSSAFNNAGGIVSGASFTASGGTSFTNSSGTVTLLGLTTSSSVTNSGGTTNIGTSGVSCSSGSLSAGTLTSTGNFTTTTTSISMSGTSTLDCTGVDVSVASSISKTSSASFNCRNLTCGTTCSFTGGTTNITGNVSATTLTLSGAAVRTINMGNGTWTLSGTGTVISLGSTPTNITLNSQGSTILLTDTSATVKNISGGGQTFNNLTVNGAASAGALTIAQNNTFNVLTLNANSNVKLTNGSTNTLSSLVAVGTSGNNVLLSSDSAGLAATISQASGTDACNFMTYQDITVTGGAAFYAGANSTSTSGNTGWIAATKPPSGQQYVGGGS